MNELVLKEMNRLSKRMEVLEPLNGKGFDHVDLEYLAAQRHLSAFMLQNAKELLDSAAKALPSEKPASRFEWNDPLDESSWHSAYPHIVCKDTLTSMYLSTGAACSLLNDLWEENQKLKDELDIS